MEPGGSTTQSGIIFQNSFAALHLARMCDSRPRPAKFQVVHVRVEAPSSVDDTVVTFADDHVEYIQSKENIRSTGDEWIALWKSFEEQFKNVVFNRHADRIILHVGTLSGLSTNLKSICEKASTSESFEEWNLRLNKVESNLINKIRLPVSGIVDDEFVALLATIHVEIAPLVAIERDWLPLWVPLTSLPLLTLFCLLRDQVGNHARIKKAFKRESLIRELEENHAVTFEELIADFTRYPSSNMLPPYESGHSIVDAAANLPPVNAQDHYQSDLNYVRSLINEGKSSEAQNFLHDLNERVFSGSSNSIKYRLLTYEACALYALGKEQQAGHKFVQAYQYSDQDDGSLAFTAFGFLILGDKTKTIEYSERALDKNPGNAKAYAMLVQALPDDLSFDEIVSHVPEAFRGLPEISYTLAFLARNRISLDEAEKWARIAIENDPDCRGEMHALLGDILIKLVMGPIESPQFLNVNECSKERLIEAVDSFTKAWNFLTDNEVKKLRIGWLTSRGFANKLLLRWDDAAHDYDHALAIAPGDYDANRFRAFLEFEQGNQNGAIFRLRKVMPCPDQPDIYFAIAGMYLEQDQYGEATTVLEQLLSELSDSKTRIDIHFMKAEIAIHSREISAARLALDEVKRLGSGRPEYRIIMASILRLEGNFDEAKKQLHIANELLAESSDLRLIYCLAREWHSVNEFREAANAYIRLADRNYPGVFTIALLKCFYSAEDYTSAIELANNLLKKNGPLHFVSELAATLYEMQGDLNSAKQVASDYLGVFPSDFRMRLQLATIYQRLRKYDGIDECLMEIPPTSELQLSDAIHTAKLLAFRGNFRKALDLAYDTRFRHPQECASHQSYINLFLATDQTDKEWLLDVTTVSDDTAVFVKSKTGREIWFVLEDFDIPTLPNQISMKHPLAMRMMGLKVGDTVLLKENEFDCEHGQIVEIKSKYIHVLHETMASIEQLFPDGTGIRMFSAQDNSVAGDNACEILAPIVKEMRKQQDHQNEVMQLYVDGKIPISMVASATGRNVVEAWANLTTNTDAGIRSCNGNQKDFESARQRLLGDSKVVLDPISLLTVFSLESCQTISSMQGRPGIAQSTIDEIHHLLLQQSGAKKQGFMSLGLEGGEIVRYETTVEDVENNRSYLQRILQWVSDNCDILPIVVPNGIYPNLNRLRPIIGDSTVDAITLCSEPSRILCSDDLLIRSLYRGEFQIEGVWTQVLLSEALSRNLISLELFCTDTIRLILNNYHHTHVNTDVLLTAARISDWSPKEPFKSVSHVLSANRSDDASSALIATQAIKQIWLEPLMEHQRIGLLQAILTSMCNGRNRDHALKRLQYFIWVAFQLMPIQYLEVSDSMAIYANSTIL